MIKVSNGKKTNYFIAISVSTLIALYFMYWHPASGYDLYIYFEWLDILRNASISEVFRFIISRGELLIMLYAYIVAKTGIYGLFQFFPTIISLSIISSISIHYAYFKGYKVRYAWYSILITLSLYEIFMIPAGVRSTLAFSIFSLGLYYEYVLKNKKQAMILYLVSPLVHLGSAIMLTVRLVMNVKRTGLRAAIILFLLFFAVFPGGELVKFIVGDSYQSGNILYINLYKLGNYLTPFFPISGPYLFKIAKLFFMLIILISVKKLKIEKYSKFYLYLAILGVTTLGNYLFWYRVLEMVIVGMPIIFIEFINHFYVKKRKLTPVLLLIVFALVGIRVQSTYYYLPNYRVLDTVPTYENRWGK